MYNGMLHLHNFLRWIILILLLVNVIYHLGSTARPFTLKDKKLALGLLIASHVTLLIGLYQYFFGNYGFKYFQDGNIGEVMKTPALRFWAIEHISGMLMAIILITIAYSTSKKNIATVSKRKKMGYLFLTALIIILLVIPWPFRDVLIRRPWFPGMH